MAKQIMQFRFYDEKKADRNQPNSIDMKSLQTGSVFTNYLPITQLGIQTLPGTKFYLNNAITPIVVGSTGIYELDLEGLSTITHIAFDNESLQAINDSPNAYLIVDAICEIA